MKPSAPTVLDLARRLMQQPAAPWFEAAVQAEVKTICAEQDLPCREDAVGNLYIHYRGSGRARPLVLAAHLDHPGFKILRALSPNRFLARFRGGVPDPYFRQGTPLRLHPGDIPARLGAKKPGVKSFELVAATPCPTKPRFAVWDLEPFRSVKGRIVGRACDDLIGSAAVLATLIRLRQSRSTTNVVGMLSRAEEIGFHGALLAAAEKQLPTNSLVISLETSRELPGVKMGQGVILRVGDKASVFDSRATRYLAEIASDLDKTARKKQPAGFPFQRALMAGGTCEATAYQEFGYQCAAVCVALGNYHNCGPRHRIAPEFVSLADVQSMVNLLVQAARKMPHFPRLTNRLPSRLHRLLKQAHSSHS